MVFRTVFTSPLPTLALLALGAGEAIVGLQAAIVSLALLIQLPVLRRVARTDKRTILVRAHALAVMGCLPLLAFRSLAAWDTQGAIAVAMLCFAVAAVGTSASDTVWFPLLRGYVEPQKTGRFFGTIRSVWHLTVIGYFLGSQAWLTRHPGDFAPLFLVGAVCGMLRIAMIRRLPERSERGEAIRVREAFALLRDAEMRNYLAASCCFTAVRATAIPFAMALLRRELGLSEGEIVYTAVATYSGGLVSLYAWGGAVDRWGALPILRATTLGMAVCLAGWMGVTQGLGSLPAAIGFFFAFAVLSSGFGVADTQFLFGLAPAHAPSRALVLASVSVGTCGALVPALAGVGLEFSLGESADGLGVYRIFFAILAAAQLAALVPLARLRTNAFSQGNPRS
jgi:predicted MFS family arabinose efflux permease